MNKQTLILIFAFILLLIPTGIVLKAYEIDKFIKLQNEGLVACSVAWLDVQDATKQQVPNPQPTPPKPSKTLCNACLGTKMIKSGDGLISVPCECGGNCKCEPKKTTTIKNNRILLFTATSYCYSCRQVETFTLPALKAVGWTFVKNENIEVIRVDTSTENEYNLAIEEVPCWVVLDGNGKEIKRYENFINAGAMGRVFRGEKLLKGDDVVLEYKTKKK